MRCNCWLAANHRVWQDLEVEAYKKKLKTLTNEETPTFIYDEVNRVWVQCESFKGNVCRNV
jgi:hypothetical protein